MEKYFLPALYVDEFIPLQTSAYFIEGSQLFSWGVCVLAQYVWVISIINF